MEPTRVLLADDDRVSRDLFNRFLTESGYHTRAVEDGSFALEEISLSNFDLVITDLMMPEMDGLHLYEIVHSPKFLQRKGGETVPPFLLCTGYGGQAVVDAALELGFADVLFKPISKERLLSAVEQAIERASLGRPLVLKGEVASKVRRVAAEFCSNSEEVLSVLLDRVSKCRLAEGIQTLEGLEDYLSQRLPLPLVGSPFDLRGADHLGQHHPDTQREGLHRESHRPPD